MYLEKEIVTGQGVTANCWVINGTQFATTSGGYSVSGNLSLYLDSVAYQSGKVLLDNATFSFNDLTKEEIDGNTLSAIASRIVASNLVDGVEANTFQTSHSGVVDFVGAIIHP